MRKRLLFAMMLCVAVLLLTVSATIAQDATAEATPEPCGTEGLLYAQEQYNAQAQEALAATTEDIPAALSQLYALGANYQALAIQCGYVNPSEAAPEHDDDEAALHRARAVGDPERGEVLFNTVQPAIGFACATCHRVDTTERLVGPGLLGVGNPAHDPSEHAMSDHPAAATESPDDHMMPGMGGMDMGNMNGMQGMDITDPEMYIRMSILHPSAFVVPGFPDNLMPQTYAEILSADEINDIVAYLLTL